MMDALMVSIFWVLSRSQLPLAEKIDVLAKALAILCDHTAELELAQLEAWYGRNDG